MLPSTVNILLLFSLVAGCAAADAGDDFSNNLFSDLAPLLALFGERVAMQFMSQSMGWADHFILAMAPVDIITIIVSAIRVGGPSWLKAIIGRARENLAVAEAELMSSTSKEVCELWNGQEVVRCMGSSPVTEFICLLPDDLEHGKSLAKLEVETIGLEEALKEENGYLETYDKGFRQSIKRKLQDDEEAKTPRRPSSPKIIVIRNTTAESPNISLNCHNQVGRRGLRVVAVIATILQLGVLTFCGFATYYPTMKYPKDDRPVQDYAFPCTATGTLTLVIGLLVCSHVIESSTEEARYKPGPGRKARMVWLQKAQTVSDQHFGSYAIFPARDREIIMTSRRTPRRRDDAPITMSAIKADIEGIASLSDIETIIGNIDKILGLKAIIGTFVSLCGFIAQFIGLRGMHWSASIAQLVAVLIMMGFMAWVRRGLAEPPRSIPLASGFELDWFATTLGNTEKAPWAKPAQKADDGTAKAFRDWIVETGQEATYHGASPEMGQEHDPRPQSPGRSGSGDESLRSAREVMKLRKKLGRLADWRSPASEEAVVVARSIEITMDALFGPTGHVQFSWSLEANFGDSNAQNKTVDFQVKKEKGKWKTYSDDIEATLSLWLYSVNSLEDKDLETQAIKFANDEGGDDAWLRTKGASTKRSVRLLGQGTKTLTQNLKWWMPSEAPSILKGEENEKMMGEVEEHRIVGGGVHQQPTTNTEGVGHTNAYDVNPGYTLLFTESHSPLKLLYAQDIFSIFMRAVAESLQGPMAGAAEIRPIDEARGTWHSFALRNSQLSKMIQEIQYTGLGSIGDIYLSVIPPLSMAHKLPHAEAIVQLAQQHAKPYERVGRFEEAGDIYFWLFQTVQVFPPESYVHAKATAVLMEHLRYPDFIVEMGNPGKVDLSITKLKWKNDRLKQRVKMIPRQHQNSAALDILARLMRLYQVQDRGWNCDLIQEDAPNVKQGLEKADESDTQEEANVEDPCDGLGNVSYLRFTKLHYLASQSKGVGNIHLHEALKKEMDVNCRDVMNWTPLHYIAAKGIPRNAIYLMWQHPVNVNACDLLDWTPLHYACLRGEETIVKHLLQRRADVNTQAKHGIAPLHCAAMNGHKNVASLLVEAGATIDALDGFQTTPLLWAVSKGHRAVVRYLWPDASRKLRDYDGRTALHLATVADDAEMATLLLEQDPPAEKDAKDRNGYTPLHWAATREKQAMARLLIEAGVDKNTRDRRGCMPLHIAVEKRDVAMVKLLVDAGAKKDVKNLKGLIPRNLAAMDRGPSPEIARLLNVNGERSEGQGGEESKDLDRSRQT
ncbi:ankyrin repeat [Fusarium albosuccineum]|uniref:protein S-acyltransferase n=1 Tax=Fusarium albosuccineum TaxID=1237068 RepID=A0A8H4PKD0_9HYPO|nr:ankyrin repeat [Fusarium albosuccineum]